MHPAQRQRAVFARPPFPAQFSAQAALGPQFGVAGADRAAIERGRGGEVPEVQLAHLARQCEAPLRAFIARPAHCDARLRIAEVAAQAGVAMLCKPRLLDAHAGFQRPVLARAPGQAGGGFAAPFRHPGARAGQGHVLAVFLQPVVAAQGIARCLEAGLQRQPCTGRMGHVDAGDVLAGIDVLQVACFVVAFDAVFTVALAAALARGHGLQRGAAAELPHVARAELGFAVVLALVDALVVVAGQRAAGVGGLAARSQVQRQATAGQRLPPVRLRLLLALALAHVPARGFDLAIGGRVDAAMAAVVVQFRHRLQRQVERAITPAAAMLHAQQRRAPAIAGHRAAFHRPFAAAIVPAHHVGQHRVAAHVDAGRAGIDQFDAVHLARGDLLEQLGGVLALAGRARAVHQHVACGAGIAAHVRIGFDQGEAGQALHHVQRIGWRRRIEPGGGKDAGARGCTGVLLLRQRRENAGARQQQAAGKQCG